jgi:hypothetical protein
MSKISVVSRALEGRDERVCRLDIAQPATTAMRARDCPSNGGAAGNSPLRHSLLNCYLEGWAEPNLARILAATARSYRFHDPLVGSFSRWSLHEYFDRVRARLSRSGAICQPDMAFCLHGPMDADRDELLFWREAPWLGLVGTARIDIGERGVCAESVAYDLNLASDLLRSA